MRRRLLLLLLLVPLLLIGGGLCLGRWRLAQVDDVYEAVLRHQIQRLDAERHPARYYLSFSAYDPAPSPQFLQRLRDLAPRVRFQDDLRMCQEPNAPKPTPGQASARRKPLEPACVQLWDGGHDYEHHSLNWRGLTNRVWVEGVVAYPSPYQHGDQYLDWRWYVLERQHGRWVVTKDNPLG